MPISVVIEVKDEQHNILDRIRELHADDVVVLDNGSSDATRAVAEALGARVFDTSGMFLRRIRQRDIDRFVRRFGSKPVALKVGDTFQHSGDRREWGATLAKHDWCYFPDCDEHTTWDKDALEALMPTCDRLLYTFVNEHFADGSPSVELTNSKFFDRRLTHWKGMLHEVGVPSPGVRTAFTDAIRVDHYQVPKPYREEALAALEFATALDPNPRNLYYLGRQYLLFGHGEVGARFLIDHFLTALPAWRVERASAFMLLANHYRSTDPETAIGYCHAAIADDDTRREPFWMLGCIHADAGNWHSARLFLETARLIPYKKESYLCDLSLYRGAIENKLAKIAEVEHGGR